MIILFVFQPNMIIFSFFSPKYDLVWEVVGDIDAHEDNLEFPAIEREPGDIRPGDLAEKDLWRLKIVEDHLNKKSDLLLVNHRQGEGEHVIVIRRHGRDRRRQVRRIRVGRLGEMY